MQMAHRRLLAAMFAALLTFVFSSGAALPAYAQDPTPTPGTGSSFSPQLNLGTNFSGLSFSTTQNGAPQAYFPVGTTEIFARFDYQNIPAGTSLVRQWYRDGVLAIQREDPWSSFWGASGRLTSISIYDYISGLTPGYYHVIISLRNYPAASIIGDFVIAGYPVTVPPPVTYSNFTDLTVSSSPAGAAMTSFPAGTTIVSARWNYANIPVGAIVVRDWYLNGVLIRSVPEAWSAYWGSNGRLTHIALYDYERGLAAGSYRLVVYLRDTPTVRAEAVFTIGDAAPGVAVFNTLTFSTMPGGLSGYLFPVGTLQVFARWNYVNPPAGTTVVRRWYRNNVLFLERREPWTLTGSGSVLNVSIYDYTYGLLAGDYRVEIGLEGIPQSFLVGYFSVV